MIGFKIDGEWLDFNATMGLEIRSSLFDTESVPGIQSYPISFNDTPRNRRLLRFPATRSRQVGPVPAAVADCYLGGSLWRRGQLRYESFDDSKYLYKFEADADALATRIEGVSLTSCELGTLPFQRVVETDEYVLFPVRNTAFYGDKNKDFCQVVNYHAAGTFLQNGATHQYTITPFLKVVPLLRRLLATFGYTLTGSWLDDPEIQQLVLYSTYSLDAGAGLGTVASFPMAQLLADVHVADLLIVLQQLFCLGYVFNPVRRQMEVRALRDVIANPAYQDRSVRQSCHDLANTLDGFTLGFTADNGDELLKNFVWPEVRLGNGKEVIRPAADTLRMVREVDPHNAGRQWLVPAAEQKGYSAHAGYDLVDTKLGQLRFLFYRGLQPDSTGGVYPLGSSGTANFLGQPVGNYALQWDGPQGLYETWHKGWLAFRGNARIEERQVPLTLADFLTLDPCRKDMVQGLKFLWERISVQVGGEKTIGEARVTYHQTAH